MNGLRIETPGRLHFGLLGWGPQHPRQFGGVGLMIERPGLSLSAQGSDRWRSSGPLSERILAFAETVNERLGRQGIEGKPLEFLVHQAPPEHVGLGVGTQLGLAVARLICESRGHVATGEQLAKLSGRGLRSGIGLHGFALGGLIVDGGRGAETVVPPLLAHRSLPEDWSILVIVPPFAPGLHGPVEIEAFRRLPPIPESTTDRLCGLVLLGLLPALAEQDIATFGDSLAAIQRLVGQGFAPVQGGIYASSELESLSRAMSKLGLFGVGQSSWGPTLYGFCRESSEFRVQVTRKLQDQFGLVEASMLWTRASHHGAVLSRLAPQ